MFEPVGTFDAPVNLGGFRRAIETQRVERCDANQRHDADQQHAGPVRHQPENAQPGKAQEQADDDEKRQDERPEALDDDRPADHGARAPKPGEQSALGCRVRPVLAGFRHPVLSGLSKWQCRNRTAPL